jgi:hypothetical protein
LGWGRSKTPIIHAANGETLSKYTPSLVYDHIHSKTVFINNYTASLEDRWQKIVMIYKNTRQRVTADRWDAGKKT